MSESHNAWIELNARLNMTQVDADLKRVKQDSDDIADELDKKAGKMQLLWTYGLQVSNMILRGLAKGAEGTALGAAANVGLAVIQVAQAETAVFMTLKQAAAAFATATPWGIVQGGILMAIAEMMQFGLIGTQMNAANARNAAREAEMFRDYVEAYAA